MKTCLSYASNAAAAVGYNIKLNCNFAASVNRGVDRNWIVATIDKRHTTTIAQTRQLEKNYQASALAREREKKCGECRRGARCDSLR